jgi:ribonuclease-3 family protein
MNKEIIRMNTTALAYLGDAVYEVEIRRRMLLKRPDHVDQLHRQSVGYVRAEAQAVAIRSLSEILTSEEADLVRRARNRKILSKPKNLDPLTYKLATAFEALIGYLYLSEQRERLDEILQRSVEIIEQEAGKHERKENQK